MLLLPPVSSGQPQLDIIHCCDWLELARARVSDTRIIELDNGSTMEQPALFAMGAD